MTAPLTNDTVITLAVIALVAICVIAWNVRWAFEKLDDGKITDRIEAAIGDATRDLLDALTEANAALDAIAEQASEHVRQNANLITLVDQATTRTGRMSYERYGRPRGFRPAETTPPYEFVDLHKHE